MNTPDELELRRALRALRQDQTPESELWLGIEARLAPRIAAAPPSRRRRPVLRWSALAAATVLALGLVLLQAGRLAPDEASGSMPAVVQTGADPGNESGDGSGNGGTADGTAAPGRDGDAATVLLEAWTQVLASERDVAPQWAHQLSLPGGAERIAARRELDASLTELAAALRISPESQLLRRLMHQTLQQRAALALTALQA